MRQIATALTSLFVLGTTAASGGESLCEQMRAWPVPRRLFAKPDQQLLRTEKRKRITVKPEEQHRSSEGNFYFAAREGNHLLLSTGDGDDLILSVPEFANRPLEARWINSKLLYLEVWFNPHYGAYWVYDVEAETVVVNELENDGQDAWSQCHPDQDPSRDTQR